LFFGNPEGRKCYEVLQGRLFPCESCATFKVIDTKIPQMRIWERFGKKFRSIVTSRKNIEIAEESLTEIKEARKRPNGG